MTSALPPAVERSRWFEESLASYCRDMYEGAKSIEDVALAQPGDVYVITKARLQTNGTTSGGTSTQKQASRTPTSTAGGGSESGDSSDRSYPHRSGPWSDTATSGASGVADVFPHSTFVSRQLNQELLRLQLELLHLRRAEVCRAANDDTERQ